MNFPPHKCGLYLEHNVYKYYYDTVEKGVADVDDICGGIPGRDGTWIAGERDKALATGEIWSLQWYPDTPVGFCKLTAASLDVLLEAANR